MKCCAADRGEWASVRTEEQARVKAVKSENRELRRANEILRKAAAYSSRAELDRCGS